MMDFDRLVTRHKDAIYRQMVRTCGNYDDAEDALIEALTAAYQHAGQLRDEGAFRGWVTTIGRRVCGHIRRREELREVLVGEDMDTYHDPSEDAQSEIEKEQLHGCVQTAVAALGEAYREVYVLREVQGLSNEETALRLGITVAAVKSRLHRARGMVRDALDNSLCGPVRVA